MATRTLLFQRERHRCADLPTRLDGLRYCKKSFLEGQERFPFPAREISAYLVPSVAPLRSVLLRDQQSRSGGDRNPFFP